MTLRARRLLYSFFIALFIIAAPPLVLYTAGFRYDFRYNRMVETGSLVVRSNPQEAEIYIDGVKYNNTTPTIINTILPGKINLLIAKEGYHSWEKAVEIQPRVTSFEEDITLYAQGEPISVIESEIKKYWWNKKQDKIAYLTKENQLRILNTLNNKDTLIANFDKKPFYDFSFSPHNDQFLFGRKTKTSVEYFVVDANFLDRVIPLSSISMSALDQVQWNPLTPNSIYALSEKSLWRISHLLKAQRLIYSGNVVSYLAEEKRIIIISELTKRSSALLWISPSDPNIIHLVPSADVSKNDSIIPTNSHRIALYREKEKQLTIIDPTIKNPLLDDAVVVISNFRGGHWSKDGQKLIYTDGFGIYTQSFNAPITVVPTISKNNLIIKYSQPIKSIAVADDEFHVFYEVGGSLRVAELGASSDPRSIVLAENLDPTNELLYVPNHKLITFINKEGVLKALSLALKDARPFFFGN